MSRTRKILLVLLGLPILYIVALVAIALAGPVLQPLATSIAVSWYEPDFVTKATSAADELSNSSERCILDDTRNIIVSDFSELDIEKILTRIVRDKYPRFRLEGPRRGPHFRMYAKGNTWAWSFRQGDFYAFPADAWAADDAMRKLCRYYREDSVNWTRVFSERHNIRVTESNFCCSALEDPT